MIMDVLVYQHSLQSRSCLTGLNKKRLLDKSVEDQEKYCYNCLKLIGLNEMQLDT